MKIYLVGGAIRDELLNLPVKEKDWVVVGATPEEMLANGFIPVGKDFPVFLHPETKEEYALARTERKVGKGYKGFTFHTDQGVSLEDDLLRRDLTINAIARDENGRLIDPYRGQEDLSKKILRHVSAAFSEDPVRILRLARFASKLPNFSVDPETNELMKAMVNNGEVNALVAERVWQEFSRALEEKQPRRFFEVLDHCDALPILFPMFSMNADDMDAFVRAIQITKNPLIRFASLWHTKTSDELIAFTKRYRAPKEYTDLAELSIRHRRAFENFLTLNAAEKLQFIKKADALRRPNRFSLMLEACQINHNNPNDAASIKAIEACVAVIKSVDIAKLQAKNLVGKEFITALEQEQLNALTKLGH